MDYNDCLAELVKRFKEDENCSEDDNIEYFSKMDLKEAIEKAALAIDKKGKVFKHQWRVNREAQKKVKDNLLKKYDDIKNCKTFDELIKVVESCIESGFGELSIYDTAMRIGSNLNIYPEKIYLHADARKGAQNIGLSGKDTLEIKDLPKELQKLKPYELENFFCLFKEELLECKQGKVPPIRKKDNC